MPKNRTEPGSASRRRFLTTFALGASAAPLLSLSRGLFAGPGTTLAGSDPASLCYSNKRVLGPADLRYLGVMRVPSQNVDMAFSYGTMTGRKVNGVVHLLMLGNITKGDPLYELADTGQYSPDVSQAPRMALVRSWGRIFGSARRSWQPDGTAKDIFFDPGALLWNEATQLLYWTFYDTYNVRGDEDWCLGASRLQDSGPVAFGPWRPSGGGRKGPWRCVRLGQHPSGDLLCGSFVMSGNASSPWGPDLWTGQFPIASTPSGFGAPDLPIQKYVTYYGMFGNINRDGTFEGPLRAFRRPGDYFFEPILGEGILTEIDPQKNNGVGSWTQLDGIGSPTWIDLPDVHGVLFAGRLAAAHVWYRNAGVGNLLCTHGQASPIDVTGPVSTDAYPVFIIYDPADLNAVRAGQRVDYTVEPSSTVNAQTAFGMKTAPITMMGSAKALGGSYFDAETRTLYVAAPQADATIPGLFNPLVHVFRVT